MWTNCVQIIGMHVIDTSIMKTFEVKRMTTTKQKGTRQR